MRAHQGYVPLSERPVDAQAVRRSKVARGRAMFLAARGNRAAYDALGAYDDDPEPPTAA